MSYAEVPNINISQMKAAYKNDVAIISVAKLGAIIEAGGLSVPILLSRGLNSGRNRETHLGKKC